MGYKIGAPKHKKKPAPGEGKPAFLIHAILCPTMRTTHLLALKNPIHINTGLSYFFTILVP